MTGITVLGSRLTPEFHGDIAGAEIVNLVRTKGGDRKKDPEKGCEVSWTFESMGGRRGLYLKYASGAERPCQMLLNEEKVLHAAAFEPTPGGAEWRYQGSVELKPGKNRISLLPHGEPPTIHALAVADPPPIQHPSIDEFYRFIKNERGTRDGSAPLQLRPADLAGVVDHARTLVRNDQALARLQEVVSWTVAAARLDALDGQTRSSWGGPMNGQRYRQHVFQRLMRLGVDVIAETGTFRGTTTAYLARQGVPVLSCEIQAKDLAAAAAHLTEYANVTLSLEDSRAFLRRLAADPAFGYRLPFFYLDAHWYEDLPLAEEISIIRGRWPDFLIMVDDFQVPGTNYTYDDYGEGRELTLAYLERNGVDLGDLAVLFPSAGDEAETGARRGTLVLTPARIYEARLALDRSVYRWPTSAKGDRS